MAAGIDLLGGISRYVSGSARRAGGVRCSSCGALSAASSTSCSRSAPSSSPTSSRASSRIPTGERPPRACRSRACRSTRDAVLVTVATIGTTLAPWGLAFIQSYAVDKRLDVEDLRYERIDVVGGAVLTGVIGVVHRRRLRRDSARARRRRSTTPRDAARALEPLAGSLASTLFGARLPRRGSSGRGDRAAVDRLLGRGGLRARAPTSTTASREAPLFYVAYGAVVAVAAAIVLIPGAPLIRDPLPVAGAQRRAAPGPAAVHAAAGT